MSSTGNTNIMYHCQASSMTHTFAQAFTMTGLFNPYLVIVYPSYGLDLNDVLGAIEKYKCFSVAALSKVITKLFEEVANSNWALESLKLVFVSGEPLNLKVLQNIKDKKSILFLMSSYSMTEFGGAASRMINLSSNTSNYSNEYNSHVPFVEFKIVDPITRETVQLGKDGFLCVRSYCAIKEYWKDEENSKKAIDKNFWYFTFLKFYFKFI